MNAEMNIIRNEKDHQIEFNVMRPEGFSYADSFSFHYLDHGNKKIHKILNKHLETLLTPHYENSIWDETKEKIKNES